MGGTEGPGWKALALDEVDAVPWRGTELVWRPVRHALGTRIVGMGGYTADHAGQVVIEGHTESEDGLNHEEVYVVLRGRATFTLDGTELDAPAGTFVAVLDPGVHRRAVAALVGTDHHGLPPAARLLLHPVQRQALLGADGPQSGAQRLGVLTRHGELLTIGGE